ncbi:MAG: 30S ribosomal protein S12 methylthiotransferase RimO [Acidobacteriota bacterium]
MSHDPAPPRPRTHDAAPRRVGMISLGCPKNLVDSEVMLGTLRGEGHEIVSDIDQADTVIVNTCAFIDPAKEESIDTILDVARRKQMDGGPSKLIVAGCMVNRYAEALAEEIPEIDGFVDLDGLREVGRVIDGARARSGGGLVTIGAPDGGRPAPPTFRSDQIASERVFDHESPRLRITPTHAYLKVAEGCNNPCTFCAIPQWRGRFRSRTIESLVEEARRFADEGVQELNLIAQDTTRYGEDLDYGRHGLVKLVEALLAATDVPWIRFLYAYPTTLDEELLVLMGQEPRFVSYLDMPLQHSHPDMLRAMRRGGRAPRYLRQLARARELAPDVFLRSTFIVGFPGETEEHADHLIDFIEEAQFDHLGGFVYSPEDGTPGAALPNRVPAGVAQRRHARLLEAQRPIAHARRQALVGRVLPVLVEGVCRETEHLLEGRHHGMAPEIDGRLLINDGVAPPGRFVELEITEAHADDLVGRIVGPRDVPGIVRSPDADLAAAHDVR